MTAKEMRDWLTVRLGEWGYVCEPIVLSMRVLEGKKDDENLDEETVRKIHDWFERTGDHGCVEHRLCGPWCQHYEPEESPMCPYTTTETETDRPIHVTLAHMRERPSCGRAWYAVSRRKVEPTPGVTVEEESDGVWVYAHEIVGGV